MYHNEKMRLMKKGSIYNVLRSDRGPLCSRWQPALTRYADPELDIKARKISVSQKIFHRLDPPPDNSGAIKLSIARN